MKDKEANVHKTQGNNVSIYLLTIIKCKPAKNDKFPRPRENAHNTLNHNCVAVNHVRDSAMMSFIY